MIVPLVGAGVKSKSAVVTAQRRVNVYLEPQPENDKTALAVYGVPGLTNVLDRGAITYRGAIVDGELAYLVQGDMFLEVNNAFLATDRNPASRLTTTGGRVSMASSGTVIVLVDGTNGYRYDIGTTTFTQISSNMFALPQTVTWQDGQFVATFSEFGTNKKRAQISADGTTWNALDFRAVESTPGALIRAFSDHGEVHQFCDTGIEFWAYTGVLDFPFQPIRGATLPIGLAARFSLAVGPQSLYFLGRNRTKGEVQVFELIGHQARPISTPELSHEINGYATKGDATGYTITLDEHVFYILSFPAAARTWMYDSYSSTVMGIPVWSELQSGGGRHFSDLQFSLVDRPYVTDYRSGKVHRIDAGVFTDAGEMIQREIDTRHFFQDYDAVTVDALTADFETGVGLLSGQGSNPQVMLSVSRDGGRTFGTEMWRSLGQTGKYQTRVEWNRLGSARDYVFRLRYSEPTKFALTGLGIRATPEQVAQVA